MERCTRRANFHLSKWRQVDFPGGGQVDFVGVSIGEYSEQVMQILPKAKICGIVLLNS
jgi:hypothetical protein